MALRLAPPARKAAATAGAALLGASASSEQRPAEQSAGPVLDQEALHASTELLKGALDELAHGKQLEGDAFSLDSPLVPLGTSDEGQQWVDVAHELLELGESVAADPAVQRAVAAKLHTFSWASLPPAQSAAPHPISLSLAPPKGSIDTARALALSELSDQDGVAVTPSEEEQLSVCSDFATVSQHFDELQSDLDALRHRCRQLESENERLRAEADPVRRQYMPHAAVLDCQSVMPWHFLYAKQSTAARAKPNARPAVARVQALARGVLTRDGFYGLKRWAANPVDVQLNPSLDVKGQPVVHVAITPRTLDEPLRKPLRKPKTQRQKELPRQAVIVTAAIVVGVLALVLMRNPAAARAASAGAATTIYALLKPKSARR